MAARLSSQKEYIREKERERAAEVFFACVCVRRGPRTLFRAPRLLLASEVPRKVKGREVHLRLLLLLLASLSLSRSYGRLPT